METPLSRREGLEEGNNGLISFIRSLAMEHAPSFAHPGAIRLKQSLCAFPVCLTHFERFSTCSVAATATN
jgi:hypothetical protein